MTTSPEKVVGEEEEVVDDEAPPAQRDETEKAKAATMWRQYREAYRKLPRVEQENETLKRQVAQLGDQKEVQVLREHVQALSTERERLVRLVEQGNIEQSEIWNNEVMAPLNQMWRTSRRSPSVTAWTPPMWRSFSKMAMTWCCRTTWMSIRPVPAIAITSLE